MASILLSLAGATVASPGGWKIAFLVGALVCGGIMSLIDAIDEMIHTKPPTSDS